MEGVKIYGLCLERLKFQILRAKERVSQEASSHCRPLLESYMTGDIGEIIDILELYDMEDRTGEHLREKLGELAYTISVLTKEDLSFDYADDGNLGLYLALQDWQEICEPMPEALAVSV